jgi:alkylhydroperoxidase/carboxymuconolactone decarboxylase family protein YurZ
MELDDLALVRRASEAAREGALDLGSFVSIAVRRYLNQAPPDEWTSLVSAMERSDNPASALLKRALASALDHYRHDDRRRLPEAGLVRDSRPSPPHVTRDEAFHGEGRELPAAAGKLAKSHPEIWKAYAALGKAAAEAGPLDGETLRLVKLALAIGASLEGAVHSHTRRAIGEGVSPEALVQVARNPTLGLPHAVQALTWIEDLLDHRSDRRGCRHEMRARNVSHGLQVSEELSR